MSIIIYKYVAKYLTTWATKNYSLFSHVPIYTQMTACSGWTSEPGLGIPDSGTISAIGQSGLSPPTSGCLPPPLVGVPRPGFHAHFYMVKEMCRGLGVGGWTQSELGLAHNIVLDISSYVINTPPFLFSNVNTPSPPLLSIIYLVVLRRPKGKYRMRCTHYQCGDSQLFNTIRCLCHMSN